MRQDSQALARLGLDSLNNFLGFWAIEVVSSCLVLDSKVIRAGAITGLA